MSRLRASNPLGIAWMTGTAASLTAMYIAARQLSAEVSTFEIVFLRVGTALLLMLPWLVRNRARAFKTGMPLMHLARGFFTFGAITLMFYGVSHAPLADATALQAVYPLFTILLAVLVFGERPGLARWLATLAGFAGVLVIVRPGFAEVSPATLALLGCSVFYALSNTVVKLMTRTDSVAQMTFLVNAIILVLSAVPAAMVWVTPSAALLPWIGLLAASGFGAQYCMTRALGHGEASVVMPFDYLRLPFATVAGFLLYTEIPDRFTVIGALIVFASVTYITAAEGRRRRRL
ncbi:MAG: DMT family transporter [Alphaproteobacteria bacterium]|nr:DMT family transporter [Alphaproteobacteria bacterium]